MSARLTHSSTTLRSDADAGSRPGAVFVPRRGDGSFWKLVALIFASIAIASAVIGFWTADGYGLPPCAQSMRECGWEP